MDSINGDDNMDNEECYDAYTFSRIQLELYGIDIIGVIIFCLLHDIELGFGLGTFITFLIPYSCAIILEMVIFVGIGIVQFIDVVKLKKRSVFTVCCFILNILTMVISIILVNSMLNTFVML